MADEQARRETIRQAARQVEEGHAFLRPGLTRRDKLRAWIRDSLIDITLRDIVEFCPLYEQDETEIRRDLEALQAEGKIKRKEIWIA